MVQMERMVQMEQVDPVEHLVLAGLQALMGFRAAQGLAVRPARQALTELMGNRAALVRLELLGRVVQAVHLVLADQVAPTVQMETQAAAEPVDLAALQVPVAHLE